MLRQFLTPYVFGRQLLLLPVLMGCSFQQMAVNQTAGILLKAMPSFEREGDYELAAQALPANLKTIEGFLESAPSNPDLLLLASQAYTSYALVVLEDQAEQAAEESPEAQRLTQRTQAMYMRGHRYGLRLLEQSQPGFTEALKKGREALDSALAECRAEDVPGLFWAGMPLAGAINQGRDDVTMIALVSKAKSLILRALELDETYYHGGGHLVMGSLFGSLPPLLGGNAQQAKTHFSRALQLTSRRFLLVQTMFAQTLAVQLQDQSLFKKLLNEVLDAKIDIDPKQVLANVTAKRKASRLIAKMKQLF